MNVSFHQYGNDFFPNSGHPDSKGCKEGLNYALNVPLRPGIKDATYHRLFKPVMKRVMELYNPNAIVMQCGADSMAYDLLGGFNLSTKGHGELVK